MPQASGGGAASERMAYHFSGFFARAKPELIESARTRWPGCRGRVITDPFKGIGVSSPPMDDADSDEAYEEACDIAATLYAELPEWSRSYPDQIFVFVDANRFGEIWEYEGYVCHNGEIRARTRGDGALKRLVAFLGVRLDDGQRFEPVEREFYAVE